MKNFLDTQGRVSGLEAQSGPQERDPLGFGDAWAKGGARGTEIALPRGIQDCGGDLEHNPCDELCCGVTDPVSNHIRQSGGIKDSRPAHVYLL